MTSKESRSAGVCMHCHTPASKARREDGTGWRAVMWCTPCGRLAHAGDSFVTDPDPMKLPIATVNQRSLPL